MNHRMWKTNGREETSSWSSDFPLNKLGRLFPWTSTDTEDYTKRNHTRIQL